LQLMKKTVAGACFLFFSLLFSACGEVKDFEFKKIESWKINGLGIGSSSISARLLFYNPNSFTVTLKQLQGDVAIDGTDLGQCISDTFVRIKSKQEFLLPVQIELKTGALLMSGLAFLGKDSLLVKFKGFMRVGRSGVFVNYKFDSESKVAAKF
jgi:LEA14-like dessication related protein